MTIRRLATVFASFMVLSSASQAMATELSLLTGLFQNSKNDPVKENRISLGGRYGEFLADSKNLLWYVDAGLGMVSYSGRGAPDDGTEITVGGGARLFFDPLGERFRPFVGLGSEFSSSKEYIAGADVEASGLYYYADTGIRLMMGNLAEFEASDVSVFIDFEVQLFNSALFATEKSTMTDPTTGAEVEVKETKFELFASGRGEVNKMTVAFGIIF